MQYQPDRVDVQQEKNASKDSELNSEKDFKASSLVWYTRITDLLVSE